jgi:hypothetical protein
MGRKRRMAKRLDPSGQRGLGFDAVAHAEQAGGELRR